MGKNFFRDAIVQNGDVRQRRRDREIEILWLKKREGDKEGGSGNVVVGGGWFLGSLTGFFCKNCWRAKTVGKKPEIEGAVIRHLPAIYLHMYSNCVHAGRRGVDPR